MKKALPLPRFLALFLALSLALPPGSAFALRDLQPVEAGVEDNLSTSLRRSTRLPVSYPEGWDRIREVAIAQALTELPDDLNKVMLTQIVRVFNKLIKEFDAEFTAAHVFRTGEYAKGVIAELRKLRYPVRRREDLAVITAGVVLHDLGKVGVPHEILYKKGKLTDEDWAQIKLHADFGADILLGLRERLPGKEGPSGHFLQQVAQIVRYHHERWDGKGYPAGLKGSTIPLGARIVAVVDAYDSIREDRPYRKGRSHEEAIAILKEERGKQFDPLIVDLFIQAFGQSNSYAYNQAEIPTTAGVEAVVQAAAGRITRIRALYSEGKLSRRDASSRLSEIAVELLKAAQQQAEEEILSSQRMVVSVPYEIGPSHAITVSPKELDGHLKSYPGEQPVPFAKEVTKNRQVFTVVTGSIGRESEAVFRPNGEGIGSDLDFIVMPSNRESIPYAEALYHRTREILADAFRKNPVLGFDADQVMVDTYHPQVEPERVPVEFLSPKVQVVDIDAWGTRESEVSSEQVSTFFRDVQFVSGDKAAFRQLQAVMRPRLYPEDPSNDPLVKELTDHLRKLSEKMGASDLGQGVDVKDPVTLIRLLIWIARASARIEISDGFGAIARMERLEWLSPKEAFELAEAYDFFLSARIALLAVQGTTLPFLEKSKKDALRLLSRDQLPQVVPFMKPEMNADTFEGVWNRHLNTVLDLVERKILSPEETGSRMDPAARGLFATVWSTWNPKRPLPEQGEAFKFARATLEGMGYRVVAVRRLRGDETGGLPGLNLGVHPESDDLPLAQFITVLLQQQPKGIKARGLEPLLENVEQHVPDGRALIWYGPNEWVVMDHGPGIPADAVGKPNFTAAIEGGVSLSGAVATSTKGTGGWGLTTALTLPGAERAEIWSNGSWMIAEGEEAGPLRGLTGDAAGVTGTLIYLPLLAEETAAGAEAVQARRGDAEKIDINAVRNAAELEDYLKTLEMRESALAGIKEGDWMGIAMSIISIRSQGPYKSVEDFVARLVGKLNIPGIKKIHLQAIANQLRYTGPAATAAAQGKTSGEAPSRRLFNKWTVFGTLVTIVLGLGSWWVYRRATALSPRVIWESSPHDLEGFRAIAERLRAFEGHSPLLYVSENSAPSLEDFEQARPATARQLTLESVDELIRLHRERGEEAARGTALSRELGGLLRVHDEGPGEVLRGLRANPESVNHPDFDRRIGRHAPLYRYLIQHPEIRIEYERPSFLSMLYGLRYGLSLRRAMELFIQPGERESYLRVMADFIQYRNLSMEERDRTFARLLRGLLERREYRGAIAVVQRGAAHYRLREYVGDLQELGFQVGEWQRRPEMDSMDELSDGQYSRTLENRPFAIPAEHELNAFRYAVSGILFALLIQRGGTDTGASSQTETVVNSLSLAEIQALRAALGPHRENFRRLSGGNFGRWSHWVSRFSVAWLTERRKIPLTVMQRLPNNFQGLTVAGVVAEMEQQLRPDQPRGALGRPQPALALGIGLNDPIPWQLAGSFLADLVAAGTEQGVRLFDGSTSVGLNGEVVFAQDLLPQRVALAGLEIGGKWIALPAAEVWSGAQIYLGPGIRLDPSVERQIGPERIIRLQGGMEQVRAFLTAEVESGRGGMALLDVPAGAERQWAPAAIGVVALSGDLAPHLSLSQLAGLEAALRRQEGGILRINGAVKRDWEEPLEVLGVAA